MEGRGEGRAGQLSLLVLSRNVVWRALGVGVEGDSVKLVCSLVLGSWGEGEMEVSRGAEKGISKDCGCNGIGLPRGWSCDTFHKLHLVLMKRELGKVPESLLPGYFVSFPQSHMPRHTSPHHRFSHGMP